MKYKLAVCVIDIEEICYTCETSLQGIAQGCVELIEHHQSEHR